MHAARIAHSLSMPHSLSVATRPVLSLLCCLCLLSLSSPRLFRLSSCLASDEALVAGGVHFPAEVRGCCAGAGGGCLIRRAFVQGITRNWCAHCVSKGLTSCSQHKAGVIPSTSIPTHALPTKFRYLSFCHTHVLVTSLVMQVAEFFDGARGKRNAHITSLHKHKHTHTHTHTHTEIQTVS